MNASPLDAATGDAATGVNANDAGADAGPPAVARCVDAAERHERAEQALASFLLRFWRADQQYLVEEIPGNAPAHYWVYAQAVDAVLDAAERTQGTRFVGLVEALLLGQAQRTWSSDWYDDENWLALVLIRAYDLTGNVEYLYRAESLLRHIMDAWDESCCGAEPGGIWWDAAHTQKATASNGGPVITAVRLHARTGGAVYLAFAERAYEYWRRTMVDADSYQVFDHVDPSGAITRWSFTYNEGVMIGAAVELYRATQEARYLEDARGYAARMRSAQTVEGSAGAVLYDGTNEGCGGDCQQFKGIGYRYLDLLERFDPDPEIRALLQSSARSLWTVARDPQSGSFSTNWAEAPSGDSVSIRQMSAAVSALSLDAAYCGGYSAEDGQTGGLKPAPTKIEAEEALLRGVALGTCTAASPVGATSRRGVRRGRVST
jgi:predicted alpha-1,6-mannanase (GH76 family)